MKRRWFLGGAALALTSTLALAAPESLLPPIFDTPAPAPSPAPSAAPAPARPSPRPATPAPSPAPGAAPSTNASPAIQPVPDFRLAFPPLGTDATGAELPRDLPTLAELEAMDEDEIDAALGLQPKFDIPPAAQRAVERVGIIAQAEGGFPSGSLAGQPPALIQAALLATRGPLVSRWGHILLRRALASRLDAPRGMNPVTFVAMRATVLNRMGEGLAARTLVQDVDSANYNRSLAGAAFSAYLATGDILGMCPVAELRGDLRDDPQWELTQAICDSYGGQARNASRRLDRALGTGLAPSIDVLLAQRFAGASGEGRRAVNIEWDNVDELTLWRYSLARSLGIDLPENLRQNAGARYDLTDVLIPAVPLAQRISAADEAAQRGLLSASAIVDLYGQAWVSDTLEDDDRQAARTLRTAYVGQNPAARLAAIRLLWDGGPTYGRQVLTAYAAARLPVNEALLDDAPAILASMMAAGLDRNAMRWAGLIEEGSPGWGVLVFAQGAGADEVGGGALGTFVEEDISADNRKSRFLLAGLAGLGRIDEGTASSYAQQLGVDLARETAWSVRIDRAGELGNGALVALLAGLGMQGEGWERMTARHLYHIVRALDRAGLNAEARMIAAEAVARG